MTKRLDHEGTIIKLKDGRVRGRIMIDRHIHQFYGKTKTEVVEHFKDLKAKITDGVNINAPKTTVGEWCQYWLDEYAQYQTKANTYEKNRYYLQNRVIPYIGRIQLDKLTGLDVQQMVNRIMRDGLQPTTARCIKNTLHAALEYAVRHDLIAKNPCKLVTIKNARYKPVQPISEDQLNAFLSVIRDYSHSLIIILTATTAMRRSEACGLKWQDFDWGQGKINIQRTVVRTRGNKTLIGDTKSDSSRRSLPLIGWVLDECKAEFEKVKQNKGIKNRFVDCNPDGSPVNPTCIYRTIQRAGKRIGIESMTVHRLRHTVASILLARGENPKVVQELLGHATLSQTMDTYSHVVPGLKEKAVAKLATVLVKPAL